MVSSLDASSVLFAVPSSTAASPSVPGPADLGGFSDSDLIHMAGAATQSASAFPQFRNLVT